MGARETALRVLVQCSTANAWADASLQAQLKRDGLSGAEAALASRLVYGVMQSKLRLDYYIGCYCTQKPDHLQRPLLEILELSAYQILYLDRIPDSAAVNEGVKLAKLMGRGPASGLINAVLRKIVANKNNLPPLPERDAVTNLSLTYSHPKWLVKRLIGLFGQEEATQILEVHNQVAPLTVQVNPLVTTQESLVSALEIAGVSVKTHPWVNGCLELTGVGDLTQLEAFQKGHFLVQDPAARLVAQIASPKAGQTVLDVCSAPGGKSFACAFEMENQGEIISCDVHNSKLVRIDQGAKRLGITTIATTCADGRVYHEDWDSQFDVVIVDAPCSGLGIIRKKPDIRYKKPDDLFTLSVVQSEILANAAAYVKVGGTLIYSTCTILPEENQQVCDAFLAEFPTFVRDSFTLGDGTVTEEGQVTLLPHRHQCDGFFICRMVRNT
ncbi:16S rRNA (cytosine(967)-C(5))-methyltransferase RsmB [Bengtsoniella intestinalis]|uniref:16S rRNA (cytosine(967)-C(5))-methyltransferase RsmB n=1 Tax=Bengtsoniella intestinalis TaxID=3073143 RepID=UPI00391F8826